MISQALGPSKADRSLQRTTTKTKHSPYAEKGELMRLVQLGFSVPIEEDVKL